MPYHLFSCLGLLASLLPLTNAWLSPAPQSHSTATLVQVVTPAQAVLQWTPPAAIPVGVALGPSQLAATANTTGSFVYTPAPGSLLQPGQQTLSVVFTPDTPNFLGASASVLITVEGPGSSTFAVSWPSNLNPAKPIYLDASGSALAILAVSPVDNFQQPVTFSCSGPAEVACTFTPATVRPTTTPVQVAFQLQYTIPAANSLRSGRRDPPLDKAAIPVIAFAGIAVLVLPRRRAPLSRRRRTTFSLLIMARLAAIALVFYVSACGGGGSPPAVLAFQLIESSVVESRSIQLTLVLPPTASQSAWR